MALTRSLDEMAADVRKCADIEARTDRFPTADVYNYVNLGLGALLRKLKQAIPDQQFLGTDTFTTEEGVALYGLPSDFRSLISIDLTANGRKRWLDSYMMHERPELTNSSVPHEGVPCVYRIQGGGNLELLPVPKGEYSVTLWYVPSGPHLARGSSAFDTVERLDQYVIWWGAREALFKEKHWDAYDRLGGRLKELEEDIYVLARSRDMNSPPRVVDVTRADRFGRTSQVDRFGRRIR